jgi:hypothetical protein
VERDQPAQEHRQAEHGFRAPDAQPEIGWTASGNANVWPYIDTPFDFTFQTRGGYTLDASKAPPPSGRPASPSAYPPGVGSCSRENASAPAAVASNPDNTRPGP